MVFTIKIMESRIIELKGSLIFFIWKDVTRHFQENFHCIFFIDYGTNGQWQFLPTTDVLNSRVK